MKNPIIRKPIKKNARLRRNAQRRRFSEEDYRAIYEGSLTREHEVDTLINYADALKRKGKTTAEIKKIIADNLVNQHGYERYAANYFVQLLMVNRNRERPVKWRNTTDYELLSRVNEIRRKAGKVQLLDFNKK